jgi:hypothetical protein
MHDQVDRVGDDRGDARYGMRAVLDGPTLDSIREANLAFLGLVVGQPTAAPRFGLSPALVAGVSRLDPRARRAVASLPYTLFNLCFEDRDFWHGVVRDASRPGAGSLEDDATFARTAIFLAWHLVQGADAAPCLVLGMTPPVVEIWRRLPLSSLDLAAMRALPRLEARWAAHARFWPRIASGAGERSPARLTELRDLGLHLLAAQGLIGAAGGG